MLVFIEFEMSKQGCVSTARQWMFIQPDLMGRKADILKLHLTSCRKQEAWHTVQGGAIPFLLMELEVCGGPLKLLYFRRQQGKVYI